MRTRLQIEADLKAGKTLDPLALEVLLDIRDLTARSKRQRAVLSDA
jgi:hypothetical protein